MIEVYKVMCHVLQAKEKVQIKFYLGEPLSPGFGKASVTRAYIPPSSGQTKISSIPSSWYKVMTLRYVVDVNGAHLTTG